MNLKDNGKNKTINLLNIVEQLNDVTEKVSNSGSVSSSGSGSTSVIAYDDTILKSDINNLNHEVTDLDTKYTRLNGEISTAKIDINKNKEEIKTLKTKVGTLSIAPSTSGLSELGTVNKNFKINIKPSETISPQTITIGLQEGQGYDNRFGIDGSNLFNNWDFEVKTGGNGKAYVNNQEIITEGSIYNRVKNILTSLDFREHIDDFQENDLKIDLKPFNPNSSNINVIEFNYKTLLENQGLMSPSPLGSVRTYKKIKFAFSDVPHKYSIDYSMNFNFKTVEIDMGELNAFQKVEKHVILNGVQTIIEIDDNDFMIRIYNKDQYSSSLEELYIYSLQLTGE